MEGDDREKVEDLRGLAADLEAAKQRTVRFLERYHKKQPDGRELRSEMDGFLRGCFAHEYLARSLTSSSREGFDLEDCGFRVDERSIVFRCSWLGNRRPYVCLYMVRLTLSGTIQTHYLEPELRSWDDLEKIIEKEIFEHGN
jgi:hypothetical protein